jgi:hypothetical protein
VIDVWRNLDLTDQPTINHIKVGKKFGNWFFFTYILKKRKNIWVYYFYGRS